MVAQWETIGVSMGRLSEMKTFVAVVDNGGFTGAAKKLETSKSAVSKSISALEARLSARLLNRTTRRVGPTEIGLAYYEKATRILKSANDADAMVTSMQSEPAGALKVSAPLSFGISHLSPVINNFLKQYKDIDIDLFVDDAQTDIVAGGFDIGIKIGSLQDSTMRARKFSETEMLLIASPEYLAIKGTPQSIEDLNRHSPLQYSQIASGQLSQLVAPQGKQRKLKVEARLIANNGEILIGAAIAGLGIATVPRFMVQAAIQSGQVVQVLPNHPLPTLGIYAIYPEGKYIQPKLRVFIDYLAAHFRTLDSW